MEFITQHILVNWKSSAQGILSVLLVAAPFATIDGSPIHNKTMLWSIAVLTAIAKVVIGFLQQDAGTTLASTSTGIKSVDSHEIPNDPTAIPTSSKP